MSCDSYMISELKCSSNKVIQNNYTIDGINGLWLYSSIIYLAQHFFKPCHRYDSIYLFFPNNIWLKHFTIPITITVWHSMARSVLYYINPHIEALMTLSLQCEWILWISCSVMSHCINSHMCDKVHNLWLFYNIFKCTCHKWNSQELH